MNAISFTSQCYWVNDQPLYLLSGEFHYFRVPKADWRRRMQLFKAAGGNCLATYVPWLLHEPEEGVFTFEGEDWLDLEGFLRTAKEEGLYVIARPGPYQYSELVYHGLPGWLVQQYPELLAQTAEGKPIGYASVSYTHPLFLEKVRNWFKRAGPRLAKHTVSRGGPIVFTQVDNELVGIHEWFGSLDYHPVTMGIGQPGGKYPLFLQARYTEISTVNRVYETDYTKFEAVRPVTHAGQDASARMRVKKDYFDFYLSTIADYVETLVRLLREEGIDTPIIHNSGNPGMNAYFQETAKRLGKDFLLGSDHYYNLDQNWPQNNPTPQYGARAFISLEMLRLMGYPPSVLEIPGGSASDWPAVTPSDAYTCYMTNLALGMKGSNYYIFTGGPNPPGAGNTTDLYDYGAGISADGQIRPLYAAQKTFGQFVQQHPGWLTARHLSDVRIGMDLEYARSEMYWNERGPFLVTNVDAWQFLRKGVLTTALCASLSPEFVDLGMDDWTKDTTTPLVIVSSVSMSAAKQQRIVKFLQGGGHVLISPVIPELDENLLPCTILADFLGHPRQTANVAGLARPRIGPVVNVNGVTYPFDSLPEGAQVIGVDEFSGKPIALRLNIEGGGQVVLLGLTWTQAMREHERMLFVVLSGLGLKRQLNCSNPNLWVTAYEGQEGLTVFVMNLFTSKMEGDITVKEKALGTVEVEPISVKVIEA